MARADREAVLVRPGDAAALRDTLRHVLDDAALRQTLSDAGHVRAAEFSMTRLAEAFAERYASIARRRSGTPAPL